MRPRPRGQDDTQNTGQRSRAQDTADECLLAVDHSIGDILRAISLSRLRHKVEDGWPPQAGNESVEASDGGGRGHVTKAGILDVFGMSNFCELPPEMLCTLHRKANWA